jgi:methylmalonyl-CoA/ethylmalonyl-CoA epimerase
MSTDNRIEDGGVTRVLSNLALHHIGVACTDLDGETKSLELLGYRRAGNDFHDPIQGVIGRFLEGPMPRVELLSEAPGSRVLSPWLKAGVKIYHMGYETASLDENLARLVGNGCHVVREPEPAVAFGGRRVAFCMLTNMMLVELIESSIPQRETPGGSIGP